MNNKKLAKAIKSLIEKEVKKMRKEILKEVRYELGEVLKEVRKSNKRTLSEESFERNSSEDESTTSISELARKAGIGEGNGVAGGSSNLNSLKDALDENYDLTGGGGSGGSTGDVKSGPKNNVDWNTGNPAIDEVLRHTEGGIPNSSTQQHPSLQGQGGESKAMINESTPDHVKNAMTRDYSELMGKLDKNKKK